MARRLGRRSRWRRWVGRGVTRILLPLSVAALAAGLVAGGVSQIGRSSGPYDRTVDLGYAALASALAADSNDAGTTLEALLESAPTLDRVTLLGRLDAISSAVHGLDRRLLALVPPAPADDAAARCNASFDARASATDDVGRALLGLLGGPAGTSPVDAGAALAALQAAGGTLAASDASWDSCRWRLRAAPGAAHLAASAWLTDDAAWSPPTLSHLVTAVLRDGALAAHHALALPAVTTAPAALVAGGAALLPPTSRVRVHVVLADQGNVDEPGVQVQVTLTPSPGAGAPQTETAIVAVATGRSVTVVLGPFDVRPGASYTVAVTAAPPQGPGATAASFVVEIAAVPTTTTTLATTTTTTTEPARRPGAGTAGGG